MGQLPSDATESKKVEKNWEGCRVQQRKEDKQRGSSCPASGLADSCVQEGQAAGRGAPQRAASCLRPPGCLPQPGLLCSSQTFRSSLVQRVGHGTSKGAVAGWMPCGPLHITFFLFLFYRPHHLGSAAFHPNTDTIY